MYSDHRRMEMRERILAGSRLVGDCMEWQGSLMRNGYGRVSFIAEGIISAHRASFHAFWHDIPEGMCVLHRCDNRRCCNPQHLFLGTKKDNTRDMVAKGRHVSPPSLRTTCPRGHPYDGVNSRGARICKRCNRQARLKHYHRTKGNNHG